MIEVCDRTTLYELIEEEIKRDLGIDVTVFAERKKPFFWDTI